MRNFHGFIQIFLLCLLGGGNPLFSSGVWLPDSTVSNRFAFLLPVRVAGISAGDSLIAFQIKIAFRPDEIEVAGIGTQGTLVEDWDEPVIHIADSILYVAGFSALPISDVHDPDVLIYIRCNAVPQFVGSTEIALRECLIFGIDGLLPLDSLASSEISVFDNFPPKIYPIGSIQFLEDASYAISLMAAITDEDDPFEDLVVEIVPSTHIATQFSIDTGMLILEPEADWNGTEPIIIQVTDPVSAWDRDTLSVTVIAVDDPPKPFHLVTPPNHAYVDGSTEYIEFSWEHAINVDEGDSVVYFLELSTSMNMIENLFEVYAGGELRTILNAGALDTGNWFWRVRAQDLRENPKFCYSPEIFHLGLMTSVEDDRMARRFALSQNVPNPFNPETAIAFEIPYSGKVRLEVMDVRGRCVRVLLEGQIEAGFHTLFWNGRGFDGESLSSGVYMARLKAGRVVLSRKMLLIR